MMDTQNKMKVAFNFQRMTSENHPKFMEYVLLRKKSGHINLEYEYMVGQLVKKEESFNNAKLFLCGVDGKVINELEFNEYSKI